MVTYDDVDVIAGFADSRDIGYTILSDSDATVIPAFGLVNSRYPEGSPFYGVAEKFILVTDADGVVRHRFSKPYPGVEAVLAAIRGSGGS